MYLNVGELSDYAKKVFREGIGHSLVLEMKKRGTEPATSTQCDQQANQMIDLSKKTLSIYGAVSIWCRGQESTGVNMFISEGNEKLSQQLNPQEVGSLARSTHRTEGTARNCWREHLAR